MSMFQVTGRVMNTFMQLPPANKETGEVGNSVPKVQIMGKIPVNGEGSKLDMITLTIPKGLDFSEYIDKEVSVPLGIFSPAKGHIVYFIPKGSTLDALST